MMGVIWRKLFMQDAYHKVTSLLWCVYMYQFVRFASNFWEVETLRIVFWSLVMMVVGEWLFSRLRWTKRLVQFISIVIVHGWVIGYELVIYEIERWSETIDLLWINIKPFHPYVWFSLAAIVLYVFLLHVVNTKRRLLVVTLLSVVSLSIVDSYTLYILWDLIATVIISALLLVIAQHFKSFKQKHPESWSHIREYPATIVVPISILLLAVMFAGIFAPTARPLITDPYTAWKQHRGEAVPAIGKGLSPIVASSGSSVSGYSRRDDALGEGFFYDHSEVMTVSTSQRSYWRGETRSIYTGAGWERSEQDMLTPTFSVALDQPLYREDESKRLNEVEVEQTVIITGESTFPVLFSASMPAALTSMSPEDGVSELRWRPDRDEIHWSGDAAQYPETYSLISHVPVLDEQVLRDAYATNDDPLPSQFEEYLQLPTTVPERVLQLAEQIVADQSTVYDQVKAIEQYLYYEYPYTNEPDLSNAHSDDFVDRFLFEVGEGYCDYFSTAMVVLVRSLGIPARWVKGYAPGSIQWMDEFDGYIPDLGTIPTDGPGTYTVRNSDAHSWVEVYFPEAGWIPFEPTSGFRYTYGINEDSALEIELGETTTSLEETDDRWVHSNFSNMIVYTIAAVFVLLALLLLFLYRHRLGSLWNDWRVRKQARINYNQKIIVDMERFVKFATRKGIARSNYETVREWLGRWGRENRWIAGDVQSLIELFEMAKYSPLLSTREQSEQVQELIKKLRIHLKTR